jgi:hypothetical protein
MPDDDPFPDAIRSEESMYKGELSYMLSRFVYAIKQGDEYAYKLLVEYVESLPDKTLHRDRSRRGKRPRKKIVELQKKIKTEVPKLIAEGIPEHEHCQTLSDLLGEEPRVIRYHLGKLKLRTPKKKLKKQK